MGMCMGLCAVGDEDIAKLLRDPPLVWKVLAPDEPGLYREARGTTGSWLKRLFGRATPLPAAEPIGPAESETDLDKSWHGIHYLLTGTAWEGEAPLDFLVRGGVPVGDVDVGYGPARAITSDGVLRIHAALAAISADDLRQRFDPDGMARLDIYPAIWADEPGAEGAFGYCSRHFANLQAFIADAAARRLGILIYTC